MFRKIDVRGEERAPAPTQPAPMLQWAEVDQLVIDEDYQRDLSRASWASIRRIASAFDWSHFGALIVAPVEGGRFAIIDGQHRAHAAAICGIGAVPVIVSLLPPSAQARAFSVINSSGVKVSPIQVYRAALASGEGWALQARDAVAAGGCRLMTSNGSSEMKRIGDVFAVTLIRELVAKGQGQLISAALPPIRRHAEAMGPMSGPLLFQAPVLRVWFDALATDPAFPGLDLDAFLRRNRLLNLLEAAAHLKSQDGHRATPLHRLKCDALTLRLRQFAGAA